MAVSKTNYGSVLLFTGTAAEVAEALSDENIPANKWNIFYNGTNVSAIVKML